MDPGHSEASFPDRRGAPIYTNSRSTGPAAAYYLTPLGEKHDYLIRCARSPYPRGNPEKTRCRPEVYPGNILAEPDKPRQDPGGTHRKLSENPSEIRSGRLVGRPKSVPGPFRIAPEQRKCKTSISGLVNSATASAPAPAAGEHTDEILREVLELAPDELVRLREEGIVS